MEQAAGPPPLVSAPTIQGMAGTTFAAGSGPVGGAPGHFTALQLPIPLALRGDRLLGRLIGLNGPRFWDAYRATLPWLVALVVTGAAGRSFAAEPLRVTAAVLSAGLGLYVIARVVTLRRLERRQHAFEPVWLAAQSQELRKQYFEVLRFTVQGRHVEHRRGRHRLYDLAETASAGDLLRRCAAERADGTGSWVTIDVALGPAPDGQYAVQSVRRRLTEIELVTGRTPVESGRARFPQAQYVPRPVFAKRAAKLPSSSTYAVLSERITVYLADPGPEGPR
jgi:hypothetical protein